VLGHRDLPSSLIENSGLDSSIDYKEVAKDYHKDNNRIADPMVRLMHFKGLAIFIV